MGILYFVFDKFSTSGIISMAIVSIVVQLHSLISIGSTLVAVKYHTQSSCSNESRVFWVQLNFSTFHSINLVFEIRCKGVALKLVEFILIVQEMALYYLV